MIRRLPLGPGSALPGWLEALETGAFGDSWGALSEAEWLWVADGRGFARWLGVPAAGEAELLRIAVAPAGRRTGLGRDLLRASEAGLGAAGIHRLHLEVRASNAAARALYEGQGWRSTGTRPRYYRDGEDAVLYGKEIWAEGSRL